MNQKKVIVFLFGMLFAFFLLEGALWSFSFFALKVSPESSEIGVKKILFLGNSHTAGWGAPPGLGYPNQVGSMLRDMKEKTIAINGGINNANSTFIAEQLAHNLKKHNPDLVVLMIGEPNLWNRYGYNKRYKTNIPTILDPIFLIIRNLKVYRLFEHLSFVLVRSPELSPSEEFQSMLHLADIWQKNQNNLESINQNEEFRDLLKKFRKFSTGEAFRENSVLREAELYRTLLKNKHRALEIFKEYLNSTDQKFSFPIYRELKRYNNQQNLETEKLINEIREILKAKAPSQSQIIELSLWFNKGILPNRVNGKTEELEKFLELALDVSRGYNRSSYISLAESLRNRGRYLESVKVICDGFRRSIYAVHPSLVPEIYLKPKNEKEAQLEKKAKEIVENFYDAHKDEFNRNSIREKLNTELAQWIHSDLTKILNLVPKNRIVLMTYPPYPLELKGAKGLNIANATIRNFSVQNNILIFDTEQKLTEFFGRKGANEWKKFYANPDDVYEQHLNELGYKTIAEQLISFFKAHEIP